jgi:hypothetical protein
MDPETEGVGRGIVPSIDQSRWLAAAAVAAVGVAAVVGVGVAAVVGVAAFAVVVVFAAVVGVAEFVVVVVFAAVVGGDTCLEMAVLRDGGEA